VKIAIAKSAYCPHGLPRWKSARAYAPSLEILDADRADKPGPT
jgi:hypothetical protein